MAGVLDSVNQRTQLVGQNRLELLLFRLQGEQIYGINVFKVKEVLQCPKLTMMPKRHPVVRGVAHIRGETIPILDMGMATGQMPVPEKDVNNCFVIITEYNRKTQGFLVSGVERIVNMNWEDMHPPPKGAGKDNYLTAVTRLENKLIEVIDVEKILAEVSPTRDTVADEFIDKELAAKAIEHKVLVVDDSTVARRQIVHCMDAVGVEVVTKNDGRQALDYLRSLVADGSRIDDHLSLMISDVEMPEMDGYTLTTNCKNDPSLKDLYIMLHTSLSGVFNKAMVAKVGADDFMAKFNPDELAQRVTSVLKTIEERRQ
ncbi:MULTISPECIES: chemotaxis protein CheV [Hahella]|uniref:Chemotaxis signal transduction protein n=1 Tax=Hahella chejuensis (strain KCTC 2396) TaxID=349521 RepID=Q2SD57_HAHCH|nr:MULTISPECIES: chemotaxis protein CheV [Hahella]ABC31417.1 Chemotaxis signal transduction protein [Hahella chejuensis KCTC 2396]AZZ91381.1 chemotaxis signal transduction protein CheV [Hahella sp. KA22]MBU6952925.1 chemotaxis protein CheV [Hahella sp. HN01]MDG9667630.1 chemotaxis protein CheV [Hahella sp. CR1]QAY54751.1 chemotaxis signal transduction protein CheV [Hahella sp. KA22]